MKSAGILVVGVDAADLGRGQVNLVDALLGEETLHAGGIDQVHAFAWRRDDALVAQALQVAHDRRTDHPTMAGDEDALIKRRAHAQFSTETGMSWPCSLSRA